MPDFDLASGDAGPDDAALATLSAPLDFTVPGVRPAVLTGSGVLTAPGTALRVSGYGITDTLPGGSPQLQSTGLVAVSDPDCQSFFPADLDRPTMLCAISPGSDSCNGDSGGPLTLNDGTLVGLVSWGPETCADPDGAPGVYTELAEPAIAAFIRAFSPGPAYAPPTSVAAPAITGVPQYGETLTCNPGSWTSTAPGAPEIDFRFAAADGTALQGWSSSATLLLRAIDAGERVLCFERARDASGASVSTSAPTEPVIGPPVLVQPPVTPPGTTPVVPTPKPVDTVSPRASFVSIRCTTARRCTVLVRATDSGKPVSGIKDIRVTLLPSRGKTRTITAKRISTGRYQARFTKVARGIVWFTIAARDHAGNRTPQPAIRRARVR